jgi:hypothetical protein
VTQEGLLELFILMCLLVPHLHLLLNFFFFFKKKKENIEIVDSHSARSGRVSG